MKKTYLRPEIEETIVAGAWELCEGSPNAFNDPNDMFSPAPKKRTPAF